MKNVAILFLTYLCHLHFPLDLFFPQEKPRLRLGNRAVLTIPQVDRESEQVAAIGPRHVVTSRTVNDTIIHAMIEFNSGERHEIYRSSRKADVFFSPNGMFVYLLIRSEGLHKVFVFETTTKSEFTISDSVDHIGAACVSPTTAAVVFQSRDLHEERLPNSYLAGPRGANPSLVGRGMVGYWSWSPDGKWFIMKEPRGTEEELTNWKTVKGHVTFVSLKWQNVIYSADGSMALELVGHNASLRSWSPDSRSLLFKERGSPSGWTVLSIDYSGEELAVLAKKNFPKEVSEGFEISGPVWSPSSNRIAYFRLYGGETGHTYTRKELWVGGLKEEEHQRLNTGDLSLEMDKLRWSSDNNLLLLVRSRTDHTVYEISIERNDLR